MVEVTNGPRNYGKFLLGRFTEDEWRRPSLVDSEMGYNAALLRRCGWTPDHLLVLDLQTGEGAILYPGGSARADLAKHSVWICPMFQPFLEWLWDRDCSDLDALPDRIDLPDAEFAWAGYRRHGCDELEALRDADFADLPREALVASIHDLAARLLAVGPERENQSS